MKKLLAKTLLTLCVCITAAFSCFAFAGCKDSKDKCNHTQVNSITLNKQSITIKQFASEQLVATTDPKEATVTWGSLDETRVIVDSKGYVRGVNVTTTPVIVTAIAGNKIAICAVSVLPSDDAYEQQPAISVSADNLTASPLDSDNKPIGYTNPLTLYQDVMWAMAGEGTDAKGKPNQDIVVDGSSKTIDGISYSQRLKLQGLGTSDARSIKLVLNRGAKIVLHCVSSSSDPTKGERVVNLYDENYMIVSGQTFNLAATSDPTVEALVITAPGTYYIGTETGGLNIYGIYIYWAA